MSRYAEPMARLIEELKKLPGVGTKSAQRFAFHILRSTDEDAAALAEAVRGLKASLRLCSSATTSPMSIPAPTAPTRPQPAADLRCRRADEHRLRWSGRADTRASITCCTDALAAARRGAGSVAHQNAHWPCRARRGGRGDSGHQPHLGGRSHGALAGQRTARLAGPDHANCHRRSRRQRHRVRRRSDDGARHGGSERPLGEFRMGRNCVISTTYIILYNLLNG